MERKTKQKSNIVPMIVAVISIALLVWGISTMGDILFGSLKTESVKITITENPTSETVAHILKENGVIKNEFLFMLLSKMKGADARYYADDFEIKKGVGYNDIINGLTYVGRYKTTNVIIPEGYTSREIANAVSESGYIGADAFEKATKGEFDYDFLPDEKREYPLEGYLFPDTYNISNTMSGEEIVNVMLERFGEIFTDEYKARAKELGYSIDEIVTLASIIEAEAASDADRKKVSGVFHNRLKSSRYPYLESCATVQYILGERKAILSASDTKIKSPYNTYINKGLPKGPICSPGKASIEAALWPEKSDYYFFQSDAEGKIYYSKTLDEHEAKRRNIQN